MNLKKIGSSVAKTARDNPALALGVLALVAPALARKVAPIVAVALSSDKPA